MIKTTRMNAHAAFRHAINRSLGARTAVVSHRLFESSALMDAARRLQDRPGLAAGAFLLGAIRPEEIVPDKLEEAFQARILGEFSSKEHTCEILAEAVFDSARKAGKKDPSIEIQVVADPDRFLTDFAHHVVFVQIIDAEFAFIADGLPADGPPADAR